MIGIPLDSDAPPLPDPNLPCPEGSALFVMRGTARSHTTASTMQAGEARRAAAWQLPAPPTHDTQQGALRARKFLAGRIRADYLHFHFLPTRTVGRRNRACGCRNQPLAELHCATAWQQRQVSLSCQKSHSGPTLDEPARHEYVLARPWVCAADSSSAGHPAWACVRLFFRTALGDDPAHQQHVSTGNRPRADTIDRLAERLSRGVKSATPLPDRILTCCYVGGGLTRKTSSAEE